jgi:transposase InsO family protein
MSTSEVSSKKSRKQKKGKEKGLQGRRFAPEQKAHALELVASGRTREAAAKAVGTTEESVRRWVREAEATGTMPPAPMTASATKRAKASVKESAESTTEKSTSTVELSTRASKEPSRSIYAPKDPGQGLSSAEQAAILELKKRHPSYGPAQIRTQLKRFKGWRVSIKAIARWLKQNGYELVHRGSRPQGYEDHRFEAPRRNAIWQMDFGEFWVGRERLHLLVVEDDFSRFVVGHVLVSEKSSKVATEVLLTAMARHGKPEAVRTDRGGEFRARSQEGDFARVLEAEEIDHIIGRSYSPKGGGKVESMVGTVRRELWEVEHFGDVAEATERLASFFDEYNHGRAHMGIDGLTPADRFFGRADQVLAAIDGISRRRQGASAMGLTEGAPIEELLGIRTGAPLEVLRLVIEDGQMTLRFCGAKVTLGKIE